MTAVPGPITVVIADDERTVRESLALILEAQPDLEVVATAADGETALRACTELRPDVALLDVRMPGRDGLWVLAALAGRGLVGPGPGAVQVLMLTTFDHARYQADAVAHGARGVLLKSLPWEELVAQVRAAHGARHRG
ncbi:response regulator transcription factor [Streptomyces harbinensis]|uniref:response regulator n=1 Tax=Streptomyces harbinensis TaxID=1176198 RepID=UPI003392FECA